MGQAMAPFSCEADTMTVGLQKADLVEQSRPQDLPDPVRSEAHDRHQLLQLFSHVRRGGVGLEGETAGAPAMWGQGPEIGGTLAHRARAGHLL